MDSNLRDPRTVVWFPFAPLLVVWLALRLTYHHWRWYRHTREMVDGTETPFEMPIGDDHA